MTSLHLSIASAAVAALMTLPASDAEAQARSSLPPTLFPNGSFGSGPLGSVPPSAVGRYDGRHWGGRHGRHHRGFFPGFIIVEREVPVVIEREVVVREVAPAAPPPPPPAPRKPFVVGQSYASLPGGCMKMIEGAASYYYCGGGEWYRPVGKQYRAIARP